MSASTDAMDEFEALVERTAWRPMDSAPEDLFVIVYCAEDRSTWWAKWQGGRWYGVDDYGLTREGYSAGDPNFVTGWAVTAWMPRPDPPYTDDRTSLKA